MEIVSKNSSNVWKEYAIKDIGTVVTGNTPPKKDPENYGGNLVWIKPPDLDKKMFVSSSEESISEIGRKKVRLLPKGSVLVSCIGNIGKLAIADCELCTNQQINSIIPNEDIVDSVFLYYTIKRMKFYLEKIASSAVVPLLNKNDFSKIKIKIPSIETQKKIVEILEKTEKLKHWRSEAGKLAEEYLKCVFFEMFGDPVKNEKGWKKVKLSELGTWKSGGTPSRQKKEFFTGNIPWYTSGELNNMYISDSVENITEEAIENSNAKLIKPNYLLLGMYDTAALKSSITTINSSCNQAIAYSKLENNYSNIIYVYFAIQIGRKFFMSRQRGIRQKNLNLTLVKDTEIPLPPLQLQNQFANIVEQFEEIKNYQTQSKEQLNNLFNTLMQKAFKGELVC
ncbi:MAG: restriction endonuclease subunit S [Methanobacterium formicicum]|uniref:restriction endonuclease subunit S n=1 Tax=Methanobacterium formicicum TaxID=2162 RepID=UPI0035317A3D